MQYGREYTAEGIATITRAPIRYGAVVSATIRAEHLRDVEALPLDLRMLLDAELARGNHIAEVSHTFPAPPIGACFMLERPMSPATRDAMPMLRYRPRNSSVCSGEITDADGIFWLLEPPIPDLDSGESKVVGVDIDAMRQSQAALAASARQKPVDSNDSRSARLVLALTVGTFYGTLTQALDEIADFHPTEVMNALFRGLMLRDGEVACHLAAMLAFLHGKADSIFDWDLRPLFLTFNTEDGSERAAACRELCVLIDVDPAHIHALLAAPLT